VAATFNITTSQALTITVDDIIAKVNANDEKIQDIKADITVTSNADFLPPTMQLKIWQKGDKQKVEEILPEPGTYIRPDLGTGETVQIDKQIISYDPTTQVYVIKCKRTDQIEEKPYILTYIDYSKGIIFKEESYSKTGSLDILLITEMSDLIQIPEADNAWLYNTKTEKMYEGPNLQYTTTYSIYNREVNTGIPDSEF
jgi:outer membrane lipoprotein-sorting protein